MITKEEFVKLINGYNAWFNKIDEVEEVTGLRCIIEGDCWMAFADKLFNMTIRILFNEEGVDNIEWWLFEKAGREEMKMWLDDKEIPTETVEDLWEIVKDSRK